jgi:hypothetical protein
MYEVGKPLKVENVTLDEPQTNEVLPLRWFQVMKGRELSREWAPGSPRFSPATTL